MKSLLRLKTKGSMLAARRDARLREYPCRRTQARGRSRYHPTMRILLLAFVAASTLAGAAPARAQDYSHYPGAWSGPFLLFVAQQDIGVQSAAEVYPGMLQIDPDGTARGSIPGAGCIFSGTTGDYVSPANASIDLMASACKDDRFNGHFVGKLIENPVMRYASLRIIAMHSLDAGIAQVSAILHR
jgi:hypothetical protein